MCVSWVLPCIGKHYGVSGPLSPEGTQWSGRLQRFGPVSWSYSSINQVGAVVGHYGPRSYSCTNAVQSRRDRQAAARFFRTLLKGQGREPRRLITDKLRSYAAAHRMIMPAVVHSTQQYENNRAEASRQPTRQRERQMRGFTSVAHAQRFLAVHGVVLNLFRVGRHLLRAVHYRLLRMRAFHVWREVTCV